MAKRWSAPAIAASLMVLVSSGICLAQAARGRASHPAYLENWAAAMSSIPLPKHGCFHASYPGTQWRETPCVAAPPAQPPARGTRPNEVGGSFTNDYSAQVPAGNAIVQATGTFTIVSGVAGEYDTSFGANAFSLQLNANSSIPTSLCRNTGCTGWEQFVFGNYPGGQYFSGIYIQYWLLNATSCPNSSWTFFPGGPGEASGCVTNQGMASYSAVAITDLENLTLQGTAGSSGDTITLIDYGTGEVTATGSDSLLNLSENWNIAEFNVFGAGNGSSTVFPAGSTLAVATQVIASAYPTCLQASTTAENDNLTLPPYCVAYDYGSILGGVTGWIEFMEDNAGYPGWPTPTANPASSITMTSAQLNGSTTDNGNAALAWFQYNTNSGALDCVSPPTTNPQIVSSAGAFNYGIGGLSSGTTYWYVACALSPATGTPLPALEQSFATSFTTLSGTYSITGQATLYGNALAGATVTLSGSQNGTAVTDASGNYSFTVAQGGNDTVGIWMPGHYFYPSPSATFTNVNGNQTANFQAGIVGDFDHAGQPDVIWEEPKVGWAQIWYLGGAMGGSFLKAANLTVANPWQIVGVGDFDGDGNSDVVWQDPVKGAVQVWYLGGPLGNQFMKALNITTSNPWRVVSVADFNGDGHPDLLWQDPTSGWAQIWYLGGAEGTTLLGAANLTKSNPWRVVGTGDFNGDGFQDVLWQDPVSGTVQIWYMGGSAAGARGAQFVSAVNLTGAIGTKVVAIADFNQDGHPDVIFQNPVAGTATINYYTGVLGDVPDGSVVLSTGNPWAIVGPH